MIKYIFRDESLNYADYFALESVCFPGDNPTEKQFESVICCDHWTARAEDGCLAGFMYVSPRGDGLHVTRLEVSPAYRRGGIATRLLSLAENRARALGCTRLTLSVLEGNAPAQAAYLKFGFAFTGHEKRRFALDLPAETAAEPLVIRRLADDGRAYSYGVEFVAGGRNVGGGVFNEEIGGCKDLILAQPDAHLPGAVAALKALLRPGARALYLMTDDAGVIAACEGYPLRLQSVMMDMVKELQ